jgi:thiamine-monophosphate kinase
VLRAALAGGDDYELVFTAPPADEAELARLSAELGFPLTCIGRIVPAEEGVTVADSNGRALEVESRGYVHFGMSTPENGAATQG